MGETDWEKLVLVLMGGAILSKSLIRFSVDGKAVFPSRFLIWDQTRVEVMKIMEVKWGEVAQLCPTLCDPMDCSPPGSLVHGIFQAWILEWVAIPFSRGSSQPRDRTQVSHIVSRCFTIWATREAPKIMGPPLKGPLFTLLHSVPLTLQQATVDPHLPRDSWTFTGKSGSVICRVIAPFSWSLLCPRFCFCLPRVCFPSPL